MTIPGPKAEPLDERRVLDAAFDVLEANGFEGLTIRRIADVLGVKNPALYWHFRNKQEIVTGMANRLLDRMTEAPNEASDWRSWLSQAAKTYRRTLLGVRDGAEILSNANLSRSRHFAEFRRGIEYLGAQGFSERDALLGMMTVFDYALGVTYEHQADARNVADDPASIPELFEPTRTGSREDIRETLFEGGLDLILDGLALRRQR
ncbi:MAG TPA: TetR family transcriptional regulator [Devosiaceae bacterium]|jgi:TetR/AcrR family tetracycline transcriptional repressor